MTTIRTGPMIVRFNDDAPGTGKSRHLRQRVATQPGRHLYCAPTLDLLGEAERDIRAMAKEAGARDLLVVSLTSEGGGGKGSVGARIGAAPAEFGGAKHVVVLTTHIGLMSADLSAFNGWTLSIDEVMTTVVCGAFCAGALWPWLEANFRLRPVGGTEWSDVTCPGDRLTRGDLARDTHLRPLVEFYGLAASLTRRLLADVTAWEDLADGREVTWWSHWPITQARAFAEVHVVGSGYVTSLAAQMEAAWELGDSEVRYERFDVAPRPPPFTSSQTPPPRRRSGRRLPVRTTSAALQGGCGRTRRRRRARCSGRGTKRCGGCCATRGWAAPRCSRSLRV